LRNDGYPQPIYRIHFRSPPANFFSGTPG
jgi:hypothetical protein